MILLSCTILLAIVVATGFLLILMKTIELTLAVTTLAAVTTGLSESVDRAVAAINSLGAPSTPDSDLLPLITAVEAQSLILNSAKAKLDAALTPPVL